MADRIRAPAVAEMTGLPLRTVQEKAAAGLIPSAARLANSRCWTFDPARVRAWIAAQEAAPCPARQEPSTGAARPIGRGYAYLDESTERAYAQLMSRKRGSAFRAKVAKIV